MKYIFLLLLFLVLDYPFFLKAQFLYTPAAKGGASGLGAILALDPATHTITTAYSFQGQLPGNLPGDECLAEYNGIIYGYTNYGGLDEKGVLFEWNPATGQYTHKLHLAEAGIERINGPLTRWNGRWYGVTAPSPATPGCIFSWEPVNNLVTIHYSITPATPVADGRTFCAGLTLLTGTLYGMTREGGAHGVGTVFAFNPGSQVFSKQADMTNAVGKYPQGRLIEYLGKMYGLASDNVSGGTLFEWDPVTNVCVTRVQFNAEARGSMPVGSLVHLQGKLYGVTTDKANVYQGAGAIFEWTPATGAFARRFEFSLPGLGNYKQPFGSLTVANGKLIGVMQKGGNYAQGALFEWNPGTGEFWEQASFGDVPGAEVNGGMVRAGNKLYGTTRKGGSGDHGTLFEWDFVNQLFTSKISFEVPLDHLDATNPLCQLNDHLYGGGTLEDGSGRLCLYRYTPHSQAFSRVWCSSSATDGKNLFERMVSYQGRLYGITYTGGNYGYGTLFEFDPGTAGFQVKHHFGGVSGIYASRLLLSGGKLYGITTNGGDYHEGVLFMFDLQSNLYQVLHSFHGVNGRYPASLALKGNTLIGFTTAGGGASGSYAVSFEWNLQTGSYTKTGEISNMGHPSSIQVRGNQLFFTLPEYSIYDFGRIVSWDIDDDALFTHKLFYCPAKPCVEGYDPHYGLTEAGNLYYGCLGSGGEFGGGLAYAFDPVSNGFTVLKSFNKSNREYAGNEWTLYDKALPENPFTHADKPALFPNPACGSFTLLVPAELVGLTATLCTMEGRVVRSWDATSEQVIEVQNFAPGVYLLRIQASVVRLVIE